MSNADYGVIVFIVLCVVAYNVNKAPQPVKEKTAHSYFSSDWHYAEVKANQSSLLSDKNYPCRLIGYGWKPLSTRRVRTKDDSWFSRGAKVTTWGWKVVVTNTLPVGVSAKASFTLTTRDKFSLARDSSHIAIAPFQTEEIQATSELEENGIGTPGDFDTSISCEIDRHSPFAPVPEFKTATELAEYWQRKSEQ